MKRPAIACALLLALLAALACRPTAPQHEPGVSPDLIVAAASNLTEAFADVGPRFTSKTGIRVIFSYGATADLAKQIENGAPFDVFAAADTEHVATLERLGLLVPGSQANYARGRLCLWLPPGSNLRLAQLPDLTRKEFERIAIPKPDVAPYGRAAVESLQAVGIWEEIKPRVVYAQNVSQAKQYAATGNAEVAFIPVALVKPNEGTALELGDELHQPLDQAVAIVKDSTKQSAARQFVEFLLGEEGQALLATRGYRKPKS